MDGVRSRTLPNLTPAQTLADVVDVFRAAREWSIDVDEEWRAQGHEPGTATFGVPVAQLDTMIIIMERALATMQQADVALTAAQHALASARRAYRFGIGCAVACLTLALVNLACVLVWWF